MISVVYYHQSIEHPMRRGIGESGSVQETARLLALSLASVGRHMPTAAPVLVTGDPEPIAKGIEIEYRPLRDPTELQRDRTRAYRDFIRQRTGQPGGALFLDTDILVTGDAAALFDDPFDVALTYADDAILPVPAELDRWGLPIDGRPCAINFGVLATRFTSATIEFFDRILARYDAIVDAGDDFLSGSRNVYTKPGGRFRIGDVRTWGGDQFAVTSVLSPLLYSNPFQQTAELAGARVRLLPTSVWNYTPPDDLAQADFAACRIAHFKGSKKVWMPIVARRLGHDVG